MNITQQLNTTKTSLIPLLCAYISDIENEVYFVKVSKNLYEGTYVHVAEILVGDLKVYISKGVSGDAITTYISTKDIFVVKFVKQIENVSVDEFFEIYSAICRVCY